MWNLKSKLIFIQWAAIGILLIALFVYKEVGEAQRERAEDAEALLHDEKEIRKRDNLSREHLIKQVEELNSAKSLKNDPEWKMLLKDVKEIKTSGIAAASVTSTHSDHYIHTSIKDSVIHDTLKTKCIEHFKNEWIEISGCSDNINVKTKDSSATFVYKGKRSKKILFFKVGPRQMEVEEVNYNPYSTTTYKRQVIIPKNK